MTTRAKPAHRGVRPTVSIAMRASTLRGLIHTDLERNGFEVRSDRAGDDIEAADVVVTDRSGPRGRLVTVRLGDEVEVLGRDGTWWFPSSQLDRLADMLHIEVDRFMEGAA